MNQPELLEPRIPIDPKVTDGSRLDLSLMEEKLAMTPWERIRAHGRALNMAVALREAMEKHNAGP